MVNAGSLFSSELIPYQYRPEKLQELFGRPILTGPQVLAVIATLTLFFTGGICLYYTFYVVFVITAVESRGPNTIGGSYSRSIRRIVETKGILGFIEDFKIFLATAFLAFISNTMLHSLALEKISEKAASLAPVWVSDIVSTFAMEPLSIIFTLGLLSKRTISYISSLQRILGMKDTYYAIAYIAALRIAVTSLQDYLVKSDFTRSHPRHFLTLTLYMFLPLARMVLIIQAHASLIDPATPTLIEFQRHPQSLRFHLWSTIVRIYKMIMLGLFYALTGFTYIIIMFLSIIAVSGQGGRILSWMYGEASEEKTPAKVTVSKGPNYKDL